MRQTHPRLPWYLEEDSDTAAKIMEEAADAIQQDQTARVTDLLRDGSLYLNRDMLSMTSGRDQYIPPMPQQILNAVQPIVDTVVSKHVESETKVSFLVEDGDFAAHRCAEDMDRFVWGEFNRLNLYLKAEHAFRDACWAGDGWLKWYEKNGKSAVDKVFPLEILIDDGACVGTEPQEMYQRRYVTRAWAMQAYPDLADEIRQLPDGMPAYSWPGVDTDVIALTEGWHLASEDGEDDGRHIMACGHILLIDEPWKYATFPFSRICWSPALVGAYSTSLVRQLLPLQLELGKMMKRIQHSLHLMSVPRVWQQAGTKITPEYDNTIGNVYKYSGAKPEIDTAPSVHPEMYAQADKLLQRMYEMARQNPMQSGQMPSRFDSRPALREAQDIADQPHAWVGENWKRLFLDCAKQQVRLAREITTEHGNYEAFGKARGFVEKIDWADCDLEDNRFVIQPTPTSLLPTTVSGKRLVVEDLFAKGLITDPNDAWELLAGMPDVDAYKSEKTAQKRLVDKQIDMMIRKGIEMEPDDCQDPVYCKQRAQAQLQLLLTQNDVPEDILDCFDNYILKCDNLHLAANPPPTPPQPGDPGLAALPPGAPNGPPAGQLPPGPGIPAGQPPPAGIPGAA